MDRQVADFFDRLSMEFGVKKTFGVGMDRKSGLTKFFKYTGYETLNEYKILSNDEELSLIQEQKKPSLVPYDIKKAFLRGRRPLTLAVSDTDQNTVLYLKRPFYLLASTTLVLNAQGLILGYIWGRFDPGFRRYDLLTKHKKLLGFIKSPVLLKHWRFPVFNPQRAKIGAVEAEWTVKEFMTERETMKIQYGKTVSWEGKMLIFALAFAISLDLYD